MDKIKIFTKIFDGEMLYRRIGDGNGNGNDWEVFFNFPQI